MPDPGFVCILTEDVDGKIARMCGEVLFLPCARHSCADGAALCCVRDKHPDGELHRDIDGIEWRQANDG